MARVGDGVKHQKGALALADIADNSKWFEADESNSLQPPDGDPEGQLPGTVNNSLRAIRGGTKRFYDHVNATVVSTGSANAHAITYPVAPAAYVTGDRYTFIVGTGLTNTGATTLNVNGLGAKAIVMGVNACQGGELHESQVVDVLYDGTSFQLLRAITPAFVRDTPANPGSTTSGTAVMMGIGGGASVITPKVSGAVQVWIAGDGFNATAGNTFTVQLRYGTGTAPVNGAAVTGTAVGSAIQIQSVANNAQCGFALVGIATGLALATAHWFDIALTSSGGVASTVQNLSVVLVELPR